MSTDLLKQIDDLVASKTFNLDALDGIKKLKDDLSQTLKTLEAKEAMLDEKRKEVVDLRATLEKRDTTIDFLNSLVKANEEMAKKGEKAIYEAQRHMAVAEAWKEAMQTVFKPNTVRETVYQSIPISQNYNGNTVVTGYHQETKTTKEEL